LISLTIGNDEMTEVINIEIYCSACGRMEHYCKIAEDIAIELGLNYTIEKVTDADRLLDFDLRVGCLLSYCPGCNFLKGKRPASPHAYVPALVLNGQLKLHSCLPSKEALRDILSECM
jgi:hypothetical protein